MILPFPADEAFLRPEFREFPQEGIEAAFSAGTRHFRYLISASDGRILLAQEAGGTRDGYYSLTTFVRWLSKIARENIPLFPVKGIVWNREATLIPAELISCDEDAERWYTLAFGPAPENHLIVCTANPFSENRVVFPFLHDLLVQLQSISSGVLLSHPYAFRSPVTIMNGKMPEMVIELMPDDHEMFIRVWKSGIMMLHNAFPAETAEEIRYFLAGISHTAGVSLANSVYMYPGTDPDMAEKISNALTAFEATPSIIPMLPGKVSGAPDGFNPAQFADILQFAF